MMKHLALPLIFLLLACNGPPPPPPPPPPPCDGLECEPPCVLNLETCECDCPPPPPTCADICAPFQGAKVNNECRCSNEYYTLTQAGILPEDYRSDCRGATGMVLKLCVQRQNLWHQGYDGPIYALRHCRSELSAIGLDDTELDRYVIEGGRLIMETDRLIVRLPMENKNFHGRSVVNREIYGPFQVTLKAHLAESERQNAAAQTDPCREQHAYDGLKGWCGRCYVE